MKRISRVGLALILIFSAGCLLQSCASSRCGCGNDLSKNYKAPKSHKRNVF
ncbi:hypothetical protein [Taibaiella lutea]|uniref:hypothetical protein n=1 Tax=Taibaiella lutea TaxID=2608001 RepID=UPI00167FE09A|nr:hypothetical protein [Taibaiella lutea]